MTDVAFKDLLYTTKDGNVMKDEMTDTYPSLYLLSNFLSYKGWVVTNNNKRAKGVL